MYITGIGWVTASGSGKGNSNDPFEFTRGVLPDISGIDFPSNPVFRRGRLDRFSLLGLQAITNALYDAGLYEWKEKREAGIIASTVYGCLKTDLDYWDTVRDEKGNLPDPNLFTHTLSNIFLGYAAILFGLTGPNYICYEKNSSGRSALFSAIESVESGECDIMLAGVCDIDISQDISISDTMIPGSIFIVIEKSPYKKNNFGRLSMDNRGNILLNKNIINDIAMCVTECIKIRHT